MFGVCVDLRSNYTYENGSNAWTAWPMMSAWKYSHWIHSASLPIKCHIDCEDNEQLYYILYIIWMCLCCTRMWFNHPSIARHSYPVTMPFRFFSLRIELYFCLTFCCCFCAFTRISRIRLGRAFFLLSQALNIVPISIPYNITIYYISCIGIWSPTRHRPQRSALV